MRYQTLGGVGPVGDTHGQIGYIRPTLTLTETRTHALCSLAMVTHSPCVRELLLLAHTPCIPHELHARLLYNLDVRVSPAEGALWTRGRRHDDWLLVELGHLDTGLGGGCRPSDTLRHRDLHLLRAREGGFCQPGNSEVTNGCVEGGSSARGKHLPEERPHAAAHVRQRIMSRGG